MLCGRGRVVPEARRKSSGEDRLYEAGEVVQQALGEHFVHLSDGGLGSHRRAKLALEHPHDGLHVGPSVVVRQELVLVEQKLAQMPRPDLALRVHDGIYFEGDERLDAEGFEHFVVIFRRVGLVGAHLAHVKVLHGLREQLRELRAVPSASHLHAGDRVGTGADHNVQLHPIVLCAELAVLLVKPAVIGDRRETRGVDRELAVFNLREWLRGLLDERHEERRGYLVGEEVGDRVEVRHPTEVALLDAVGEVRLGATLRLSEVHLRDGGERGFLKRNRRTPPA